MWHKMLDAKVFPTSPTSTKAVLSKLALDQAGFAPLINTAFLTWLHVLSGGSLATALPYIAVRPARLKTGHCMPVSALWSEHSLRDCLSQDAWPVGWPHTDVKLASMFTLVDSDTAASPGWLNLRIA